MTNTAHFLTGGHAPRARRVLSPRVTMILPGLRVDMAARGVGRPRMGSGQGAAGPEEQSTHNSDHAHPKSPSISTVLHITLLNLSCKAQFLQQSNTVAVKSQ